MKKTLKLNLGAGSNRIEGFINIDTEPSCKPDVVCDFVSNKLPYKDSTVEEVVFFHCIEHIRKAFHKRILTEIWRVLKPGSSFLISYPEFSRCYDNWKKNYRGKRDFWEKTIFGRQLYPSDHHVCIMHTPEFIDLLRDCGFHINYSNPEPLESHNTVISASKIDKPTNYEDLIRTDKVKVTIKKVGKK